MHMTVDPTQTSMGHIRLSKFVVNLTRWTTKLLCIISQSLNQSLVASCSSETYATQLWLFYAGQFSYATAE